MRILLDFHGLLLGWGAGMILPPYRVQFSVTAPQFDADETGQADPLEVARMLRELADKIEQTGQLAHVLRCVNGNRIGYAGRVAFANLSKLSKA